MPQSCSTSPSPRPNSPIASALERTPASSRRSRAVLFGRPTRVSSVPKFRLAPLTLEQVPNVHKFLELLPPLLHMAYLCRIRRGTRTPTRGASNIQKVSRTGSGDVLIFSHPSSRHGRGGRSRIGLTPRLWSVQRRRFPLHYRRALAHLAQTWEQVVLGQSEGGPEGSWFGHRWVMRPGIRVRASRFVCPPHASSEPKSTCIAHKT